MKDAMIIVFQSQHWGNSVIENVLSYVLKSPFAETDEILSNGIRSDSLQHMIEDFYAVQDMRDMEQHRRVFHLAITTRNSKMMDTVMEDGAACLRNYCEMIGHQALLVPHYGSERHCMNHHWHIVINPISYITGQRLLDKYETFNNMTCYLNQNTRTSWTWKSKCHE